jgi:polysaccharide export outer membrane protein
MPAAAKRDLERSAPDDYQIGAGDVLTVNVWKEPDASAAGLVVRNDGKITLPLLKDVVVAGLTLHQAEKLITEQLSKYIMAPDVAVIATSISSQKIYLIGAVKKEGPMPLTFRMNVLQALSEAGGLTEFAKKKRIYVLRSEGGREFRLPFDYTEVLKGTHMELNILLKPGDTIVVPH